MCGGGGGDVCLVVNIAIFPNVSGFTIVYVCVVCVCVAIFPNWSHASVLQIITLHCVL